MRSRPLYGQRLRTLYGQSGKLAAQVYREAAAIMEREGYSAVSSADHAIRIAAAKRWCGSTHRSYINRVLPQIAFVDFFGCWINNDEGVLMLCFAACAAETGDMV